MVGRSAGTSLLVPNNHPDRYDDFKAAVVSDQSADDQGVYEVWWHANALYPDEPLSARLAIAEAVVLDLWREGRVALVARPWGGPEGEGEPITEVESVLRDWATWVPQADKPVVWIVSP
jgi:hypothetical protein